MKSNSKRFLYGLQIFGSLLGIALSLYLLVQHTRITTGIQASASFCSFGGIADCDVVNASPFSEVAGVPIATFGAIFYFLTLLLSLIAPPSNRGFKGAQRLIAWLSVAALVIDLVLFGLQVFSLRSLCIMCFGSYLATLIVLGSGLAMVEESPSRLRNAFIGKGPRLSGTATAVAVIGFVAFSTLVALIPYYIRTNSRIYERVQSALDQFYASWKERPGRNIETFAGDGTRGNPAAKIRVVEFSDYQCPHCRRAAFTLHTALKPLEDHVQFIFKNYPLDSSCNSLLTYSLHPHACNLARLGVCAQRKGKFWEYHDLVFLRLTEDDFRPDWGVVASKLAPVFTSEEISQCLQDEQSLAAVKQSIDLGNSLGVKGTPSVYIDGKQMGIPITVETIRKLIELEAGT